MRKINNKAFTIVELIAAIAIMAVILLITVPNILGVVEQNKKRTYINDAKKLIALAKNKFKADSTYKDPTQNVCLVFKLNELTDSLQKGPNGGKYLDNYTYVTISKESGSNYIYGVQVVEEFESGGNRLYRGISHSTEGEFLVNKQNEKINSDYSSLSDLTSVNQVGGQCRGGIYYSDGSAEGNEVEGNIKGGEELRAEFILGGNVSKIVYTAEGGEAVPSNTICTNTGVFTCSIVLKCIANDSGTCSVRTPAITASDGYTSVGFSNVRGKVGTKLKNITLNQRNTTYYANALDKTAPIISLDKDYDETYSANKTITVTASDKGSGLASNAKIYYYWSKSSTEKPKDGAYTLMSYSYLGANFTAIARVQSGARYEGAYYLYLKTELKDNDGNAQSYEQVYGPYNFNNTPFECSFDVPDVMEVKTSYHIGLTCQDHTIGMRDQTLPPTALDVFFNQSHDLYKVDISYPRNNSILVPNGYKYDIVVKPKFTGVFKLTLQKGIVSNAVGRVNENSFSSKNIQVRGKTYTASLEKGSNVSSLSSTKVSCTTSGNSDTCNVVLPNYVTYNGYTMLGWSKDKDSDAGDMPGSSVTLRDNTILYANAIDKTAPSFSFSVSKPDERYTKKKTITIDATDFGSGINSDSVLEYGFVEFPDDASIYSYPIYDKVIDDSGKEVLEEVLPAETFTVSPTISPDGKTATFTIEESSITGVYYLRVSSIHLVDNDGNLKDDVIYSAPYFFDNEGPLISLSKNGDASIKNEERLSIYATDMDWGISDTDLKIHYGWSKTVTDPPSTWKSCYLKKTNSDINSFYFAEGKCDIVENDPLDGKYYLWVDPGNLQDVGSNKSSLNYTSDDSGHSGYFVSPNTFYFNDNSIPYWTIESVKTDSTNPHVVSLNSLRTKEDAVNITILGRDEMGLNISETNEKLKDLESKIIVQHTDENYNITDYTSEYFTLERLDDEMEVDIFDSQEETPNNTLGVRYVIHLKPRTDITTRGTIEVFISSNTLVDSKGNKNKNGNTSASALLATGINVIDATCVAATETTLHQTMAGSKVLTYGRAPTLYEDEFGDAYDCDVNNDGIYDKQEERFYFLKEQNDVVSLIASKNQYYNTHFGSREFFDDSTGYYYYLPTSAVNLLPTKDTWSAVSLSFLEKSIVDEEGNKIHTNKKIDYSDRAARLPTFQDLGKCLVKNDGTSYSVNPINDCLFLMETQFYWLENLGKRGSNYSSVYIVSPFIESFTYEFGADIFSYSPDNTTAWVRPVIEVDYNKLFR